jgi:lipopolysaccharide export system protein LptA
MASSTRKILLLGCAWALPVFGAPKPAPLPIDFTAQSSEIDYKNSFTSFRKVQITQGNLSITADAGQVKGTGVNFQDNHWIFRGAVKITVEQGVLNSDEAQVFFSNNQLTRATASGKPATFEQRIVKADKTVNGHAASIDYDASRGMVHLTGDAFLSDGQNEIRDQALKYNISAQSLIADPSEQQGQRVHIIITPPPPKSSGAAAGPAATPGSPAQPGSTAPKPVPPVPNQ